MHLQRLCASLAPGLRMNMFCFYSRSPRTSTRQSSLTTNSSVRPGYVRTTSAPSSELYRSAYYKRSTQQRQDSSAIHGLRSLQETTYSCAFPPLTSRPLVASRMAGRLLFCSKEGKLNSQWMNAEVEWNRAHPMRH
eukprot:TRINITY_DN3359_c0_g1_i2.p1 TRINITY_DN3359_c0_g1~~TRINITY_DN3359_c0_g1_i2.p1  ORF type:complete len:136 (-),score=0.85 TRINITY_DN3359_c0_g1_i2:88-495(-)